MSHRIEPEQSLGANFVGPDRCQFVVWAPLAKRVDLHILQPRERVVPMEEGEPGYYRVTVQGVAPDCLYLYRLDGQKERPDPASRFQPRGVHGPSQVPESVFTWDDGEWHGLPLQQYILYEIHTGTFTLEGTLDAIIPRLGDLKELGITALELMPVAQFPGTRNWGYDGVYPFAVQASYGGPRALKRLVNACHQQGLAIVLDVVYNHLGPEGNYLWDFGPYFTDRYRTPWGEAVNFDGPWSDHVRRFFVENALYWVTEFHVDALRLDAVHAIYDFSARPFLEELAEAVEQQAQRLGRQIHLIAESDLNDPRLIQPRDLGGYGLDAQWSDDFHHALHTLLTGEKAGYYQDFGTVEHLVRFFREGYSYTGQYSRYRRRRHGRSPGTRAGHQFVVCAQNHDQVGNRMLGERLSQLVPFQALKLAAAAVILSPFIPLLFMGEEYGETAPFQYFTSHLDPHLVEAVRKGRREEFSAFSWLGEPPDPQDERTFLRSRPDRRLRHKGHHRVLIDFYRELIRLRKTVPALASLSKEQMQVLGLEAPRVLFLHRWTGNDAAVLAFHLGDGTVSVALPVPSGRWHKLLDSEDERWCGSGSSVPELLVSKGEVDLTLGPWAFVLFSPTADTWASS